MRRNSARTRMEKLRNTFSNQMKNSWNIGVYSPHLIASLEIRNQPDKDFFTASNKTMVKNNSLKELSSAASQEKVQMVTSILSPMPTNMKGSNNTTNAHTYQQTTKLSTSNNFSGHDWNEDHRKQPMSPVEKRFHIKNDLKFSS